MDLLEEAVGVDPGDAGEPEFLGRRFCKVPNALRTSPECNGA